MKYEAIIVLMIKMVTINTTFGDFSDIPILQNIFIEFGVSTSNLSVIDYIL